MTWTPSTPPVELTKIDVAALKQATYLLICKNRGSSEPSCFQAVKEFEKSEKNPFATREYHTIAAPVRVRYDYRSPDAQWKCFASVWLYSSQHTQPSSIIATLRAGDEIALEFYPDGHQNGYVKDAGLHADFVNLLVYRKGRLHATWELESSICRDNSARMCQQIYGRELLQITGVDGFSR